MDIKYTETQAIALNALADAARRVRDEAASVRTAAENISFQLEKGYQPSAGFGKNKLSEAVAAYNAVADIAGPVCDSLSSKELEHSFLLANRADPKGIGGQHYFSSSN